MRFKIKRLLGILLSFALMLGLMPGMGLTAYAEDYTSLSDGQILHVGDTFTPEVDYSIAGYTGWSLAKRVAPYKLVRVNLIGSGLRFTIVESDEGQYYGFYVGGWNNYNIERYDENPEGLGYIVFETTATSDGLTVTRSGDTVSFAVHEATTVAVTGVTLNPSITNLTAQGDPVTLTATVCPDNATDRKVKWSTSSANIKLYTDTSCTTEVGTDATDTLTVYAKAMSAGYIETVTVTSNADNSKSASCTITANKVNPTAPTGLTATYGQTLANVTLPHVGVSAVDIVVGDSAKV